MDNLYEYVRSVFIKSTEGKFLTFPEAEQEEMILSVVKKAIERGNV